MGNSATAYNPIGTIHGHPVLAWAQTEVQSTGPCGIVLVQTRDGSHLTLRAEYCVAWYRVGDREWSTGHYFYDKAAAFSDFYERAKNGFKQPKVG